MGATYIILETVKFLLMMIVLILGVFGEINFIVAMLGIAVITIAHKGIMKRMFPENAESKSE